MSARHKNRRLVKFMEWISDINTATLPAPPASDADSDHLPARSRRSISFGSMNPVQVSPCGEANGPPRRRVIQFGELPVSPSSPAVAMPKVRRAARPVMPTPPRETMSPSTPEPAREAAEATAIAAPPATTEAAVDDGTPAAPPMEAMSSAAVDPSIGAPAMKHDMPDMPNMPYIPVPDGRGGYFWMPAGYPPHMHHPAMAQLPMPPAAPAAPYYPPSSFSSGTHASTPSSSSSATIDSAMAGGVASYPTHPMAPYHPAPMSETGEPPIDWCPPSPPSGHMPYMAANAPAGAPMGPPPMLYSPHPPLSQAGPAAHSDAGYWVDPMTGMCIPAMAPSPGTPFDPNMPPPPPPPPPMPPTSGHFAPYSYPYPMPYGYPGPMPLAISPASPMECGWTSEPHPATTPGPAKSKLKASAPEFVPGRLLQAKQQKQHGSTEHATTAATASTPLQTPPLSASTSDYSNNNELPMES